MVADSDQEFDADSGREVEYNEASTARLTQAEQKVADEAESVQDTGDRDEESQKEIPLNEKLPEGVDFSEGGWATDFAASIIGLCFFISSFQYEEEYQHFRWMMGGTAAAHLFGGLAHRFFPNRAADGVGMPGFYCTMIAGYAGNCARYGLGWGLAGAWWMVGLANFVWMLGAGIYVISKMEWSNAKVDEARGSDFVPDRLFGFGEVWCFVGELAACIVYLVSEGGINAGVYTWIAVIFNICGWVVVYFVGAVCFFLGKNYDPNLSQRIFHYCMLVMLWSMHMIATS